VLCRTDGGEKGLEEMGAVRVERYPVVPVGGRLALEADVPEQAQHPRQALFMPDWSTLCHDAPQEVVEKQPSRRRPRKPFCAA
jgi:hypothetical protein